MKVLIDSSSLIAFAKIGAIELLKNLFGEIYITEEIKSEVVFGSTSDAAIIRERIGKWIKILKFTPPGYFKDVRGIGEGERSILEYAKDNKGTLLILDEIEARAIAESENLNFTGTIGLTVFACERGKISSEEGIDLIKKLSKSDFRMTVELYDWAMEKFKELKK